MTFSPTIRKLILEEPGRETRRRHPHQQGRRHAGLHHELRDLIQKDMIDRPTAFEVAPNAEALKMALKGIELREAGIL